MTSTLGLLLSYKNVHYFRCFFLFLYVQQVAGMKYEVFFFFWFSLIDVVKF